MTTIHGVNIVGKNYQIIWIYLKAHIKLLVVYVVNVQRYELRLKSLNGFTVTAYNGVISMESKQLTDYPPEEQAELKNIMAFMVRNNVVQIKRWGGDMELSLHCRDGMYAVDMRCGESKIGGDARTPQHRGDIQ